MTRTLSLIGAMLTVGMLAASAAMPAPDSNPAQSRYVVAEYMRAVPAGPSAAIRCRRVCVKSGRGTPTHPPQCLQWRIVC
jgi:hypothetical protein